ncbi:Pol protein [Phytophthora palmivora]|uniref:Pol protein n=1 Tax=Phytophthora palmivora TaxID=4796 RepID=A0A2P4YHK1_9STRA|nr:Pol protein [Phytophthora palmivora]
MKASAASVSSASNIVPHGVKKTVPYALHLHDRSKTNIIVSGRQVKGDSVHLEALPEVSALLNLEELSTKAFLVGLKAIDSAETVLPKPETSPEDLNSSSVMDEDLLEGFTR